VNSSGVSGTPERARLSTARCQRAAEYSRGHGGIGLIILDDGEVAWEEYATAHGAERAHDIASGTKSLTGLMAVLAASDGLLALDEPVVRTLPEWEGDAARTKVTIRVLLQLVSGMESGTKPGRTPSYEVALRTRLVAEPGTRFFYGAAPFQVFGEVLRRKLEPICPDPATYLQARLLDRIGVEPKRWRSGTDGYPNLSSGVCLTARSWARLGQWVTNGGAWDGRRLLAEPALDECWVGSEPNPAYGLGWWLNAPVEGNQRALLRHQALGLEDLRSDPLIPHDLVYAAGAGKQRLYVFRRKRVVVARHSTGLAEALARGERGGFSDREFLRRLLGNEDELEPHDGIRDG
jgi:CubicO group peptidase (beta-lactamase class C family)